MTEKEKAKDLVEWYAEELPGIEFGSSKFVILERNWPLAKKCAVHVIDTILEGRNLLRLPLSYWEGVKQEIEKL